MAANGNYLEPQGISVRHGVCGDPKQVEKRSDRVRVFSVICCYQLGVEKDGRVIFFSSRKVKNLFFRRSSRISIIKIMYVAVEITKKTWNTPSSSDECVVGTWYPRLSLLAHMRFAVFRCTSHFVCAWHKVVRSVGCSSVIRAPSQGVESIQGVEKQIRPSRS